LRENLLQAENEIKVKRRKDCNNVSTDGVTSKTRMLQKQQRRSALSVDGIANETAESLSGARTNGIE